MARLPTARGGCEPFSATGGLLDMTSADDLKGSLERLAGAANTALRTPVGDVAWDELARIVAAEHATLSTGLDSEPIDGMRSRIVADAECVRASLAASRIRGTRAAAAQRRTVKYCQNMRSEIEKLSFALQELTSQDLATARRET